MKISGTFILGVGESVRGKRTRTRTRIRTRTRTARKPKKIKKAGAKLVRTPKRSSKKTILKKEPLKRIEKSETAQITNKDKLNIWVLTKPFETMNSDPNDNMIKAMEQFAEIRYWFEGGSMLNIVKQIDMKPDFILYYLADESSIMTVINELDKTDIPMGYYVTDEQASEIDQRTYIRDHKFDLIFAENHHSFVTSLPEYEGRVRLLPAALPQYELSGTGNTHAEYFSRMRAEKLISYINQFIVENTSIVQAVTTNKKISAAVPAPPQRKLKVLILVKPFTKTMPKHQHKYDIIRAIEKVADVRYWHKNGNILDILKKINMKPDFIFHYDIAWNYAFAPKITNLDKVKIPVGCYVMDVHWNKKFRRAYFRRIAKPKLIFSVSKYPFLKVFPECKSRFRWSPFAINPNVIKDYKLKKNIKYSLLGLIKPQYKFRKAVLRKMRKVKGFINFKHPGHRARARRGLLINDNYAKVINRSQISFTCGSDLKIPVAKFFELPGCNTLMLAEPNRDLKDLGFKDKVNYVACNRKNFYRKALHFQRNKRARARITQNGYNFIRKYHTNHVRAQQFVAAVNVLLKRK